MRAREILQENYSQSLESDLDNLLVGAKANGAQEVNTQDVVSQLYSMGYAVDGNSIMSLLANNEMVLNATPQKIRLKPPEGAMSGDGGATQDSAARVSDMAQSATKIGS